MSEFWQKQQFATITPEHRAAKVISDYFASDLDVVNGAEGEKRTIESLIAAAIREAEDAALERAAVAALKALGGPAHTYASENADIYRAQDHALATAAERIRSLKHKEP